MGFFHELGLQRRVEIGLDPELVPLVIFLLELRNPVAMGRKLRRIAQDEGGLQIGLDDIFRRRQNIGDQVVAELDLVVERTADLELGQPVNTGGNDGTEARCGDQSKNQYRA